MRDPSTGRGSGEGRPCIGTMYLIKCLSIELRGGEEPI
jgi:hypothetical protein